MIDECALSELLLNKNYKSKIFGIKKGKIEGLPRMLTVIARSFLFDKAIVNLPQLQKAELCEYFLRLWFGFEKDYENNEKYLKLPSKFQNAANWLGWYIVQSQQNNSNENYEAVKENVKSYAKTYASKLFQNTDSGKNDRNKKTYQSIIADAFDLGGLKKYCLKIKKSKEITAQKGDLNAMLSIVAYILSENDRAQNEENNFVTVFAVDLANWLQIRPDNGGQGKKSVAAYLSYDKFLFVPNGSDSPKSLFVKRELTAAQANRNQYMVNTDWLKEFDVSLFSYQEESEIEKDNQYRYFVNDIKGVKELH